MESNGENEIEPTKSDEAPTSVTWTLLWTVSAVAIGSGFQHGYNLTVVNPSAKVMESWIKEAMDLNEEQLIFMWSSIVSMINIGGVLGSAVTGVFTSKFGRRLVLIWNNVIAIVASLLMGSSKYANQPWMLLVGRFLIGVYTGVASVAANMYTSEISPTKIRGAIGATYQVMMTVSMLFATIVANENCLGTERLWPVLMLLPMIPAAYQFLALLASPESPKYLMGLGLESKALSETIRLCGETQGRELIVVIKNELVDTTTGSLSLISMLTTPKYRKPLIIVCIVMAAQQLTGLNDITYYSTEIFKTAGLSEESSQYGTIVFGVVIMVSSMSALLMVDHFGRKSLLVCGFSCLAVDLIGLVICLSFKSSIVATYLSIVLILLMVVIYQLGPGTIRWIICSELFTTRARGLGLSIGTSVNWLANFAVGIAFLPLYAHVGPFVFLIFAVICFLSAIYSYVQIPETKNKPLGEIAALFEECSTTKL